MKIPLSNALLDEKDIYEVLKVLKSKRLALGPYMKKFEEMVKNYVDTKYAVAVSSGTAALHLILKSLDFGENDILLTSSFTFISSANVALYEKGNVHFVDIEPDTLNVSLNALEEEIIKTKKKNSRLFFMGVDIFGHPLDWDKILDICQKYSVEIIEDSCEALGSEYKGKKCGTFGQAGAFAFYPNKQITTGEGGIIVTNNEKIYQITKAMRNQGRTSSKWLSHEVIGYNYRIDEMSSALGYSQMKKIDKIIEMRNKAAKNYEKLLTFLEIPVIKSYVTKMSWFVYVVKLPKGTDINKVIDYMAKNEIETRNYFAPIHLQPVYKKLGWKEGMLPITEEISKRTLAIPFYSEITFEEQEKVAFYLKKALELFS
ncbi:polysaccharide biosynthesis protein [Thermosipho melanesiensis]|uniref:DegT/DnrJ/EryC1/StrS aminotransferase n=2 Tax=Thermosipho melanesiensis TaxID=46541 RepID=A6LP63_THEM4|nr:DegT/DnrJ/EryC1/StrS family aminotransferase [Thermosipho melanesiensis]ABR31714.1 DegT/DnrJ/EryC1/StrS aminotransferase [Thermosipho melanesiensis BI429]APT74737.1 polysaccharide biosynthesis protein [Thermosipho melanesiensis]OOC35239.1 polysaccharide biosynthesis protein [Thermosipho melanesiensis]OOC35449.1 polysaccharide biosynthesis protein [Thermosipho melanesiensis]OOC36700.1 polysaccharide biosynthesis protein [Thermosipho melanesiensis]